MKKAERKKMREKIKRTKPVTRLSLPSNRRHKTKKDYKRLKKVPIEN